MEKVFMMESRIAELYAEIRYYKLRIQTLKNDKETYKLLTAKIKIAQNEIKDLENQLENMNTFQYYCQEVDDESM